MIKKPIYIMSSKEDVMPTTFSEEEAYRFAIESGALPVLEKLNALGIDYEYYYHRHAFSMEDLATVDEQIGGVYCKNLFLHSSNNKHHYLVVVSEDNRVNLKELAKIITSSRLSFAHEDYLYRYLKLTKGVVGPFGLLNDSEHHTKLILDQTLQGEQRISFHPNANNQTVVISFKDLIKVLEDLNYDYQVVNFKESE